MTSDLSLNGAHNAKPTTDQHEQPARSLSARRRALYTPWSPDWRPYLSGQGGQSRYAPKRRRAAIARELTEIPPPASTRIVQDYLNRELDESTFIGSPDAITTRLNGATAFVRGRAASGRAPEGATSEALRKLKQIEQHPVPLYVPSDYSPRLAPDTYNQLSALSDPVLRRLYTGRDREMALHEPHLAGLVALSRQEGVGWMSNTWAGLNASRKRGRDLWADFASCFELPSPSNPAAAREATRQHLAALCYGRKPREVMPLLADEYARRGGRRHGNDPFWPVRNHSVFEEMRRAGDRILARIGSRGGLSDAEGRFLQPNQFEGRDRRERIERLIFYVADSFGQKALSVAFRAASAELERDRPRFRIWLYRGTGFTLRLSCPEEESRSVVEFLQGAVAESASNVQMTTGLDATWP